jgi:hypothetical protein
MQKQMRVPMLGIQKEGNPTVLISKAAVVELSTKENMLTLVPVVRIKSFFAIRHGRHLICTDWNSILLQASYRHRDAH